MEIVRVVVAGRKYHDIFFPVHLLCCCESDSEISELESAEPSLVLMTSLRIKHHCLTVHESLAGILECLGILAHVGKAFITHSVCREKSHGTQSLVENRIIEDICPRKEIHPSVSKLKAYAERVVKTVLMIGNNDGRSAVDRHVLKSDDVLLLEIQAGIHELKIGAERLHDEGVLPRILSSHVLVFSFSTKTKIRTFC